jgi:hypothetical protein
MIKKIALTGDSAAVAISRMGFGKYAPPNILRHLVSSCPI